MEAAAQLRRDHDFSHADIEAISVRTFLEASRLATAEPATTDEAQYSLPFPLAALLARDGSAGRDRRRRHSPIPRYCACRAELQLDRRSALFLAVSRRALGGNRASGSRTAEGWHPSRQWRAAAPKIRFPTAR